jgi:hypothetical protein
MRLQEDAMKDETLAPPIYPGREGSDDASVGEKASESVRKVAAGVEAAYEQARKPGMPLSVLANIAREAPLGSLLVAFLLGVAVARRR